jgi:hypothetical protein
MVALVLTVIVLEGVPVRVPVPVTVLVPVSDPVTVPVTVPDPLLVMVGLGLSEADLV